MPLSDDLTLLPDNSNQEITPADVRAAFQSIYTSLGDDEDFTGTTAASLSTLTTSVAGKQANLDVAFTDLDLTGDLADLFGGTIDLGTNGAVTMRYRRVGRVVDGWLWIGADDDATYGSGGPFYIPGSALPYAPQTPPSNPSGGSEGWVFPSGYGFFLSIGGGFQFGASPTIANIGSAAMVFAKTDANTSGLDGIVSDSSPQNLKLDFWAYSGYFAYIANAAA